MNFMHQYHSVSTHCAAVVVTAVVAGIAAGVRVRMMIFHVKISIFFIHKGVAALVVVAGALVVEAAVMAAVVGVKRRRVMFFMSGEAVFHRN